VDKANNAGFVHMLENENEQQQPKNFALKFLEQPNKPVVTDLSSSAQPQNEKPSERLLLPDPEILNFHSKAEALMKEIEHKHEQADRKHKLAASDSANKGSSDNKDIPALEAVMNTADTRSRDKEGNLTKIPSSQRVNWRDPPKIILVRDIPSQGAGNFLHGLLAAHLLGEEYGRIVCVSKLRMSEFHAAFEMVHPLAIHHCPHVWSEEFGYYRYRYLPRYTDNMIEVLNFLPPPNECALRKKLESSVSPYIFTINTYPRWPKVPENLFFQYYKAKPVLLEMLPYYAAPSSPKVPSSLSLLNNNQNNKPPPPKTVVHLRMGDDLVDVRKGLDEASLQALGRHLPKGNSTYLVTNRVEWYDFFEKNFGWSHPNWKQVRQEIHPLASRLGALL
jgi:hypothetical protein